MIVIQRITPESALVFKEVRLRALQDAPTAFSSTFARESQFPDEEWVRLAERWSGAGGDTVLLAMDGEHACGIVGSYVEPENPRRAHVVSMWVDSIYRRGGVGRALMDAVIEWNRSHGVCELALMVTSVNSGAMTFYEGLSFSRTGVTTEYPNDAAIVEYEMSLQIPLIAR